MHKELLEKTAQFHKLAFEEINTLRSKIASYEKEEEAREYAEDKLKVAVKKAADALYESDFITDSHSYRDFVKKASIDPANLAKAIEKVCSYKDVSGIGTVSSVTIKTAEEDNDPIMVRAFGRNSSSTNLFED